MGPLLKGEEKTQSALFQMEGAHREMVLFQMAKGIQRKGEWLRCLKLHKKWSS